MDKQKAEKAARAPSAPVESEERTLDQAKEAFKAALDKTRKQVEADLPDEPKEEATAEAVPHKPKAAKPKAEKVAPKDAPDPVAEMRSKVEALEARLAEASKPKVEEKKPEPKKSQLEEVRAYLAEQFGEDEADTLTKAFGSILEPMMKRTEQLESILTEASKRGREQASKTNQQRLTEKFPHLKNKAAWDMVKAQADALSEREPSKFNTPDEVYDHVAETLFGGLEQRETEPEPEEEEAEEVERIKASTVSDAGRAKRERRLSNDERARAVFNHLIKDPEDLSGAKKVARQARSL